MKLDNTKILVIIAVVAGLLLATPYFLRVLKGNPYSINSESYYNLRLYGIEKSSYYDSLEERHLPYNMLQGIDIGKADMAVYSKILVLLLGIASVILSYIILKRHNMNDKTIWVILLIMIASPIFIYTFMDLNYYAIIVFLNLLIIYLLTLEKMTYTIISAVIFCAIPFINIYGAIISFIFLILYILTNYSSFKKHSIVLILAIIAILSSIAVNTLLGYNIISSIPMTKSNIITDIGADIGFSFSSFILSIIGLILLWEKGWKNLIIYLSIIIFLVLSIFNVFLRVYLNFLLVIYAGFAFTYLMRRKWSIHIIKRITILLIVCSMLFTTLVYVTNLVKSSPDPAYINALTFLKEQSLPEERVLSSASNGFLIEYYAQRSSFLDSNTIVYEPHNLVILDNISSSRNLERTENLLKDNGIKYIMIDNDFRQYLDEKEGLLFLIATSNKFKNIYKNPGMEIWMYVK